MAYQRDTVWCTRDIIKVEQLSVFVMSLVKKDTRLNIRITDEELDLLKELAAEAKMTLADWVRQKLLGHGDELSELRLQVRSLNERLAALESRIMKAA